MNLFLKSEAIKVVDDKLAIALMKGGLSPIEAIKTSQKIQRNKKFKELISKGQDTVRCSYDRYSKNVSCIAPIALALDPLDMGLDSLIWLVVGVSCTGIIIKTVTSCSEAFRDGGRHFSDMLPPLVDGVIGIIILGAVPYIMKYYIDKNAKRTEEDVKDTIEKAKNLGNVASLYFRT